MRSSTLILLGSVAVSAVAIYLYMRHRHRNFIGDLTYSCTQTCDIANPSAMNTCENDPNGVPCQSFKNCLLECRKDQSELMAVNKESWSGPYGKLLS